jgi:hypothetical protein
MNSLNLSLFSAQPFLLLTVLAVLPSASGGTLWTNALPSNGNTGYDAAPLYGSLSDSNLPGAPVKPFILGDQFTLSGSSNTINSVTIYEVGNVVTTATGTPGDTPDTEFSTLSLYIGPDGSATGLGSAVDTIGGAPLFSASTQVCYGGACGSGGVNFQSIYTSSVYYAIYAVTFSGLNITLPSGLYDFAIGATPIGGNTFALLTSDPNNSGTSEEDSATLCPNCGFLYYFYDGTGGAPLATYQYLPGSISGYNNGADVNVLISGSSVPEPSTFGLIGLGLGGVLLGLRQRVRR